jgi:hypothetical protein
MLSPNQGKKARTAKKRPLRKPRVDLTVDETREEVEYKISAETATKLFQEANKYCCGEGYLQAEDETGAKFRFRLVSEPNPQTITATIGAFVAKIRAVFSKPGEISEEDVAKFGIFCASSSLTSFTNGKAEGLFLGLDGVEALTSALNEIKPHPYLQIEVSSRLVYGDVLLLNFAIFITQKEGKPCAQNVIIGDLSLSGYYNIQNCGSKLCIDTATVHVRTPGCAN